MRELPRAFLRVIPEEKFAVRGFPHFLRERRPPAGLRLGTNERDCAEALEFAVAAGVEKFVRGPGGTERFEFGRGFHESPC